MKKYLRNILLFFITVAIIDFLFGQACQYMNDHSKGGGIKSRHYVCKESKEDVLVFGSSRAKHHYVPDIIEDTLNLTCYNTGEDGNGIILCYGFLKMITARYYPKLILYDVTGFDIYEDDNMKYLDLMKPFYFSPGIDSIFWSVEPTTRLMMHSGLYRFNTSCLRIVGNYLYPMNSYPKGYSPIYDTMDYEPEELVYKVGEIDTLKIHYFEEFIRLTQQHNILLICCVSPSYLAPVDDEYYAPIKTLCARFDVPFMYYGAIEEISTQKKYFVNREHLNHDGASQYTSYMINFVHSILCKKFTDRTNSFSHLKD